MHARHIVLAVLAAAGHPDIRCSGWPRRSEAAAGDRLGGSVSVHAVFDGGTNPASRQESFFSWN